MKKLVKEIIGPQFKNFVIRSKNCNPGITWGLEPKLGVLVFSFKDIKPNYIDINIRRIGGNGVCTYVSDGQLLDFKIASQKYQKMTFPVGPSGIVEFKRNKSSVGNIEISSISLYIDEKEFSGNWNTVLKKCKIKGLTIADGHLLASEGSTIKADKIEVLETNPPNVYSLTETDVYFISKCEITRLIVKGNVQTDSLYKHFDSEPNVLNHDDNINSQIIAQPKLQIKQKKQQIETPGINRLVFDSSVLGFQKYTSFGNVEIKKDYLIMDFNAEYKIPLKFIYPDSEYIIIVEAQNMSGNGKITMTMDNALNDSNSAFTIGNGKRTINKKIKASANVDGASLIIGRSPSGKGKILISKILLILDIDKATKIPKKIYNSNFEQNNNNFLTVDSDDEVLKSALAFSRHVSYHGFIKTSDFSNKIAIQTFSGMSWFSKIQPLFPNCNLDENAKTFISSIKNINEFCESVFIEEFGEHNINENKLKNIKKIITPCERNAEQIANYGNIELGIKYWPYTLPESISFIKDKFIVLFNRNSSVTKEIIYGLSNKFGKIVVLGARGNYPDFVIPVNEYLDYRNLCWLLLNAESVIDIPLINDYLSGALELVHAMGTPIATSNWKYQDKENIIFLNSTEKFDDYKVPNVESIKDSIRELTSSGIQRKSINEDYNINVIQGFRSLYE